MRIIAFVLVSLFLSSAMACKIRFPDESQCPSGNKIEIKDKSLLILKKTVSNYYNNRDKYIFSREKKMTEKDRLRSIRSSCFNLRHAEMYINYIIQVRAKSTKICSDNVELMIKSIEQLMDARTEENRFIVDQKSKINLIDLSMDVSEALAAFKAENSL